MTGTDALEPRSGEAAAPAASGASDNRRLLLAVAGVALVSVVLYRVLFSWLFDQWLTDRLYSHGFIVPLVSLYLLWTSRDRLYFTRIRPALWSGAGLLLVSAALLVAGRWGVFVLFEAVSFLFFLPGIILLLWGWGCLRVLLFPVLYLQFMVPWADPVLPHLQKPFQLVSANLSVWLFRLLGVPVYQNGVFIDLPGLSLEVARECSGVHFILSVMAVGIPLVYLTQRTWRRAAVVLASGAVITILANGLRIVIDGVLGMRYGAELLHGPGHIFRGWFVAQVGWVGIFVVNWLMTRGGDRSAPRLCDRWRSLRAARADSNRVPLLRFWVSGIALAVFVLALEVAAPAAVPMSRSLAAFPRSVGQWTGEDVDWPAAKEMFSGVDESLSRVYKDGAGNQLRLFLGYAGVQREGRALVSNRTGPLYKNMESAPTGLGSPWPSDVGEGELQLGGGTYAATFWYQFQCFGTSQKFRAKLGLVRYALLERRSDGMVVIVAVPIRRGGWNKAAAGAIADFLEKTRPHIAVSMGLAGISAPLDTFRINN